MKIVLALLPILFFIVGNVEAQEEIEIFSNNTPLILPATSPAIVEQKAGSVLTGTIHGATSLECTLENCMTTQDFNGIKFEGEMPSYEAKIQTSSETVVFEPLADTGLPYGLTVLDVVLMAIGIGAAVIAVVAVKRKLEVS